MYLWLHPSVFSICVRSPFVFFYRMRLCLATLKCALPVPSQKKALQRVSRAARLFIFF